MYPVNLGAWKLFKCNLNKFVLKLLTEESKGHRMKYCSAVRYRIFQRNANDTFPKENNSQVNGNHLTRLIQKNLFELNRI